MRLTVPDRQPKGKYRHAIISKYWALFQHELLFLSWGMMDVALLTPLALILMPWARYWPPGLFFLWLLAVMMLSFNLSRSMSALKLRPSIQQTVSALTLMVVVIISLRSLFHQPQSFIDMGWLSEFFASLNTPGDALWLRDAVLFGLIVLMWMRGIQMAGRIFNIHRIGLRLRVGGLLIAPLIIWGSNRNLFWSATPFILLFFLAGLTAVALTRAEEIAKDETGFSASLTPRWLLLIVSAGSVIVFLAGVAAIIISGKPGTAVVGILEPVWTAILATGTIALATIGFLLQPILLFSNWLFTTLTTNFGFIGNTVYLIFVFFAKIISKLFWTEPDTANQFPVSGPLPALEAADTPYGFSLNGQIIIILLAIAVILIVALMIRHLYKATAMADRTTRHAQAQSTEADEKQNLLQKLFGKFGLRSWRTAVTIRRIYKQMMQTASQNGHPKLKSETPYEYLTTLDKAWPQNPQDLRVITDAYVKIRYGELPETDQELSLIQQAWQQLQQAQLVSENSQARST